MEARWLLMLGSNLNDDARVHDAIRALARLGPARALTAVRDTAARRGGGRFHNVLVELRCGGRAAALRRQLKDIETALGRVRDDSGVVAIDIDLLACDRGGGWIADAHARSKAEFDQPPAPALLEEAGIVLR